MNAAFPIDTDALWSQVSNRQAKEKIAKQIVEQATNGDVIGFGSGTTSMICAIEFGNAVKEGMEISAVVTSFELGWLCEKLGIDVLNIEETKIDWCFDGADEVDPQNRLIKGGGAKGKGRRGEAGCPAKGRRPIRGLRIGPQSGPGGRDVAPGPEKRRRRETASSVFREGL